jgi:hypothetical protein
MTGFDVSVLRFGAMRLPLRGSSTADIDEPVAVRMIRTPIDAGVKTVRRGGSPLSAKRVYGPRDLWYVPAGFCQPMVANCCDLQRTWAAVLADTALTKSREKAG